MLVGVDLDLLPVGFEDGADFGVGADVEGGKRDKRPWTRDRTRGAGF